MRKEVIGDCELYLGDCRDVLPTINDNYMHSALVTDPPYGIGENNKKVMSRGKLALPKDYGYFDWDKEKPSKSTIDQCRMRAKYQIIFGGIYFELPPTKCWLVWDKLNGNNDFADCELAWTNLDMAVRRIRHLWHGMIRKGKEERFHPTQKPLEVINWAISFLPKEVNTIIDPFMGSGTTGVACVKSGRKFIGIELEESYFNTACKRIEEAYKQPDMLIEVSKKHEQTDMINNLKVENA